MNGADTLTIHRPDGTAAATEQSRRFLRTRGFTERLCEPLAVEDYVIQTMPLASPTKWHLAHTTWFFETLVLVPAIPTYRPIHPEYGYLFNSYYQTLGPRHAQAERGLLSRPTVREIYDYRRAVDDRMLDLFHRGVPATYRDVVELGIHHEQQHQELMLTDLKHLFALNPLRPSYGAVMAERAGEPAPSLGWTGFAGCLTAIGHTGEGFAFDNEQPRHRAALEPFELANRLVTNGEYAAFIADGAYQRPELWLSDGWNAVQTYPWEAPLYWERRDDRWWTMTLAGVHALAPNEPVCHVSYYEADAYARWVGARLPSEAEWEHAAAECPIQGNFAESGRLHPAAIASGTRSLAQCFGDVWEWTRSAYAPYPGFTLARGALGEYNGKFMCNQMVLRGGSCATSRTHIRASYRNFFRPDARWQFTGIRLARDAS